MELEVEQAIWFGGVGYATALYTVDPGTPTFTLTDEAGTVWPVQAVQVTLYAYRLAVRGDLMMAPGCATLSDGSEQAEWSVVDAVTPAQFVEGALRLSEAFEVKVASA